MEEIPSNAAKCEPKKTSNVFAFPTQNTHVPPEFKERQVKAFLSAVNEDICTAIVYSLESAGIDLSGEKFREDMLIVQLVLESVLYRTEGIEHEFTPLIDDIQNSLLGEEDEQQGE